MSILVFFFEFDESRGEIYEGVFDFWKLGIRINVEEGGGRSICRFWGYVRRKIECGIKCGFYLFGGKWDLIFVYRVVCKLGICKIFVFLYRY